MSTMIADHHVNDFDDWFEIFTSNPPPEVGSWRVLRGIDDPNRVLVVGELDDSEIDAAKQFVASDKMQEVFARVNEMSTRDMEIVWLEDVRGG